MYAQSALISRSVVCCAPPGGYPLDMSHIEEAIDIERFIGEVEVSISDAVDSLGTTESARLYAEILDVEQRLEALRDVLTVLAVSG
jgi:hypothetical protein